MKSRFVVIFALVAGLVFGLASAQEFDWQELGEQTYANCAACHQATGQGIPAAFPPLAGNLPQLYAAEGGRSYLINVLLYGLQGQIEVLDASYNSVMPPWSQLSNEQLAAVLNFSLTSWDNSEMLPEDFSPILPDEVAAQRDQGLSSADVLNIRSELVFGE